jgi:cell division protease FtsH
MTSANRSRTRSLQTMLAGIFLTFWVVVPAASPAIAEVVSPQDANTTLSGSLKGDQVEGKVVVEPGSPAVDTTKLPLLDKKGIPFRETLGSSVSITKQLVIQLAASGEIRSVYLEDGRSLGGLVTTGGVVMAFNYDASPELLQALIAADLQPQFVTFKDAPVTEQERINEQADKTNWSKILMFAPILIVISGVIIIYEIRQRDIRKSRVTSDDEKTVFQTREGPGGSIPTVTFADVAGCEEAMEDLSEIVEFLRDPERFERLGAKIPRGALLVGPPGTGKTLLARAVAGEAKVDFFAASGSDFVEMYVGVGPARVRELFTKARLSEKAIIFIDEIDAVARSRAMSTKQNANDERENTLNALLHELDGFSRSNVILLAATNRVDILDPAIIRPGRLDRKIQVPNPDRRGREKILKVHTVGKPLAKDVDLAAIAKRTPGMSGADLAQITNEAAIEAARRNLKSIDASCFSAAVALVAMGRARKSALVTDRDRLITAYHEAGHTICAIKQANASNPAGVSITPRGHAGGITWMNGSDDQYMARAQAEAQLVVALGGRAGEEVLLGGEFTQGPSSDLEKATELATIMVTRYGMTRRGLAVRSGTPDGQSHDVIEELLSNALEQARLMIDENRALFSAIVNQLLEHETLESGDLEDLIASVASGGDHHPSFSEHTARALQLAGHVAAEALGNVVSKAGRAVRRQPAKSEVTENNQGAANVNNDTQVDHLGAPNPVATGKAASKPIKPRRATTSGADKGSSVARPKRRSKKNPDPATA